jgi:hypothetical protein
MSAGIDNATILRLLVEEALGKRPRCNGLDATLRDLCGAPATCCGHLRRSRVRCDEHAQTAEWEDLDDAPTTRALVAWLALSPNVEDSRGDMLDRLEALSVPVGRLSDRVAKP